MNYAGILISTLSINLILACSLHVVFGLGGLLFVAQYALMGVGAYTAGILAAQLGVPLLLAILVGIVTGALMGAAFGALTSRVRGYDYVLITFVFQMILTEFFMQADDITGGTSGIYGVRTPVMPFADLVGIPFAYGIFALLLAVLILIGTYFLTRSQFGLSVRAFREGEPSTMALGISTRQVRVLALTLCGAGSGLAGGLLLGQIGAIYPTNFTVQLSILVIVYLVVGGIGNVWGALAGVVVVMAVPQVLGALRFIPAALLGPINQIIYGVIIMAMVWFRPSGIIPEWPSFRLSKGRRRDAEELPVAGKGVGA